MTSRQATGFQDFEKTPPNCFGVDANGMWKTGIVGRAALGVLPPLAGGAKRLAINRHRERPLDSFEPLWAGAQITTYSTTWPGRILPLQEYSRATTNIVDGNRLHMSDVRMSQTSA